MARVVFGALALVDSVLVLYLLLSYDWLRFKTGSRSWYIFRPV